MTAIYDMCGVSARHGDIIQCKNNSIGVLKLIADDWYIASYSHGYDAIDSHTALDKVADVSECIIIGNVFRR